VKTRKTKEETKQYEKTIRSQRGAADGKGMLSSRIHGVKPMQMQRMQTKERERKKSAPFTFPSFICQEERRERAPDTQTHR
jgi:hypothetical protein